MDKNKEHTNFPKFALQQTNCCKCNKVIKKDRLCHHIAALRSIDSTNEFEQYDDDDILCESCYEDYLISNMNRLGITVVDKNGQWKNFNEILKEFYQVWGKY